MAQSAGMDGSLLQASFDFLPADMRRRLRFGDNSSADRAEFRARMQQIDRQFANLGSRIAAARMREVLRPAPEPGADPLAPTEIPIALVPPTSPECPTGQELTRQRDALREIGAAIFHFDSGREDEQYRHLGPGSQQQRLHPRPLPARYYDVPPRSCDTGPLKR